MKLKVHELWSGRRICELVPCPELFVFQVDTNESISVAPVAATTSHHPPSQPPSHQPHSSPPPSATAVGSTQASVNPPVQRFMKVFARMIAVFGSATVSILRNEAILASFAISVEL